MRKEIKKIDVLQAGKVSGVLYALLTIPILLIYIPFLGFFMAAAGDEFGSELPMIGGGIIGMFILAPIIYGIFGFIFGIISAFIYNLVAKWVGGHIITLEDVVD